MVSHMLDLSNYTGEAVLSVRILEPSFGNGAFLKEIVSRILKESSAKGMTTEDTASTIDNNVHGIEIDREIYKRTVDELVEMCSRHGVHTSFPNLLNMDAMDIDHPSSMTSLLPILPMSEYTSWMRVHDRRQSAGLWAPESRTCTQSSSTSAVAFWKTMEPLVSSHLSHGSKTRVRPL